MKKMDRIYTSAEQLIGRTPLLELVQTEREFNLKAKVLAKLEYLNPAGSVKDRVAAAIISEAEKQGKIKPDTVIIEPTSGNTGIGLAMVATARNLRLILVMPETMSEERKKLMRAYGAELVLTEGKKGMAGAIQRAEELCREIPNSFIAGQFVNPANPKAHYLTTGPEIMEDTDGKIDIFVAGIGTGGTITGTSKYLKEKKPTVKVIGIEPADSPFLSEGKTGPHTIQGIGAGFKPDILELSLVDEIIPVTGKDAVDTAKYLGKREGILTGISSGAALYVAIEEAKKTENEGKTIVVLLPDGGDRYYSTPLFEE